MTVLQDLPEDLLLDIFEHLHAFDILSLRQTCRALESATRGRAVWHEALLRHSQGSCLPIPGLPRQGLSALSASDLERLTLRSLRYWSDWLSPQPQAQESVSMRPVKSISSHIGARNLAVSFLPDFPGHILALALYDTAHHQRYSFELWEITTMSAPRFVDDLPVEALLAFAVNDVLGSSCALAVTRRDTNTAQLVTNTYSIRLADAEEGGVRFHSMIQFPGYRNTIGLHGSWLVATDAEQDVRIINVEAGRLEFTLKAPLILNDPTLRFAERQCMDTVILDGFILSFCKQYIFLYHIPPSPDPDCEAPGVDAVATYKWRWRIDTLVAKPRRNPHPNTSGRGTAHTKPPLIDILIRFDTWFPWPVNVVHHFVLAPNPAYDAPSDSVSGTFDPAQPSALPYLLSATDGPFMVHSIPSPLRIFTPSDTVLGSYGTALWIDASTDATTPSQAGDHGQRIAGCVLPRAPLPRVRIRPGEGPHDDHVSPGLVEPAAPSSSAHVENAELRAMPMADAEARRPVVSVFHVQEAEEKWNRLAVDEGSGRIAVGQIDGTVIVYSYVPP